MWVKPIKMEPGNLKLLLHTLSTKSDKSYKNFFSRWQDFKTVRAKSALSTYIYQYLHRAGFALTVLKSCQIHWLIIQN